MASPGTLRKGEGRPLEEPNVPDPDKLAVGKIVVLGLGNQYMRDDGVGIAVARELQRRDFGEGVIVRTHQTFDLWLLSEYSEASRLIIIDSVKAGTRPGTVAEYEVTPRSGPFSSLPGLHSVKLHDLIDFASRTGLLSCPVTVIGVEPENCEVGEGFSPEVERAVPEAVTRVAERIGRRAQSVSGD